MSAPIGTAIPSITELQANAARLLQQSLASAQQAAGPLNTLSPQDLELARSNTRALAFVQAVGLHGAYRYLREFVARQAIPIKASGQYLDGWLEAYGLTRKTAAAASGQINGTGIAGTLLTTGTLVQAADGKQYRVVADIAVDIGGTVLASVVAVAAGLAGNLAAGAALALVSPVVGINAAFTVATLGIGAGADLETDAQAVYRLGQRLANEPMGGSPADYARWALQVAGITRAWGLRNPGGPCTAGVIIMADANSAPGLPSPAQQAQVLAYISDPERGPPDELFVIIPTPVVVDFVVNVVPDTVAIRAAVVAELKDVFFREALPAGSIPHSHVVEAISSVAGEYNHTVVSPTLASGGAFTVGAFDQLLMLGTVAFV